MQDYFKLHNESNSKISDASHLFADDRYLGVHSFAMENISERGLDVLMTMNHQSQARAAIPISVCSRYDLRTRHTHSIPHSL